MGSLANFSVDLTDASLYVSGEVDAATHSILMRGTSMGAGASTRTVSTIDPSTGLQSGLLTGGELTMSLNNDVADLGGLVVEEDGVIDLRTDVNTLRISTGNSDTALDYGISVVNTGSMTIDAVMASEGQITLESTAGTLDIQAVIDTAGGVALKSNDNLSIVSQLESGQGLVTIESAGDVNVNAAITTSDAQGPLDIIAGGNVTITSLVSSGEVVTIDAGGNIATVNTTSVIEGPSATLTAGGTIDVGLELADGAPGEITASSGGAMILREYIAEYTEDDLAPGTYFQNDPFVLSNLDTTDGSITVDSVRSIEALDVVAGGTGGVSLTTTEGDIEIFDVIAVDSQVTLDAQGFDDVDDFDGGVDAVANRLGGTVFLNDDEAPIVAGSVDFTVYSLDVDASGTLDPFENFYAGVGTVAATVVYDGLDPLYLGSGDILLSSDSALVVERALTTQGKVEIVVQGGLTISGAGVTANTNDALTTTADVQIAAVGGGVTIGAAVSTNDDNAQIDIAALQDIVVNPALASPGVNAVVTALQVNVFAGLTGNTADVGTESQSACSIGSDIE